MGELPLPRQEIQAVVDRALAEDIGWGDITTEALVPVNYRASGNVLAKAAGVIAGLPIAALVFTTVDPEVTFEPLVADGTAVDRGQVVARVSGRAASLMTAERVALNFLQRLSGIATETSRYVGAIAGLPAVIVDTRKTTPGLRSLEKYAVRMGGGQNHRHNLSDGVLIKDNHLVAVAGQKLTLAKAVAAARRRWPHTVKVEVEVDRLDQIDDALAAGADIILLDNMSPAEMRRAIERIAGRARTEASGGVTLETVRAIAETGVDLISVGALTHSARALDLSLDLEL